MLYIPRLRRFVRSRATRRVLRGVEDAMRGCSSGLNMTRNRLTILVWCLLTLYPSAAGAKVEPWAEQSLPVTQGLAVWLDAAPQPAAWRASGRPPLESQGALDV